MSPFCSNPCLKIFSANTQTNVHHVLANPISKYLLRAGDGDGSGGDGGGSPFLAFEDLDSDGDLCISGAEAGCPCSLEGSQEECDQCSHSLISNIARGDDCISPEDWDAYIDGLSDGGGDGGGDGSDSGDFSCARGGCACRDVCACRDTVPIDSPMSSLVPPSLSCPYAE